MTKQEAIKTLKTFEIGYLHTTEQVINFVKKIELTSKQPCKLCISENAINSLKTRNIDWTNFEYCPTCGRQL